jgi:hypothetical protein
MLRKAERGELRLHTSVFGLLKAGRASRAPEGQNRRRASLRRDALCVLARNHRPVAGLEEQIERFLQQRLDGGVFIDHDAAELFIDGRVEIPPDMLAPSRRLFFPGSRVAGRAGSGLIFQRACELVGHGRFPD